MSREKRLNHIILVLLWMLTLVIIAPLLLVVANSVKTTAESDIMTLAPPEKMRWGNFATVFTEGRVLQSFFNSFFVTSIAVALSAVLGAMAAYVLARNRSRMNRFVRKYFMVGLVLPMQFITLIETLKVYRLYNNTFGLILVYVAIFLPMSIMLVYGSVSAIPREMDEAAIMDGYGPLRQFFQVIMPLLTPVVVTVIVTQFMFVWNDFQFPLYLITNTNKWTLLLGVYGFMGKYSTSWNLVSAHILVSSLPVVIIYLLGQKYIISGMVAGAVKG
jgi:raffinose/stachyose/melibiose transport system permease protein